MDQLIVQRAANGQSRNACRMDEREHGVLTAKCSEFCKVEGGRAVLGHKSDRCYALSLKCLQAPQCAGQRGDGEFGTDGEHMGIGVVVLLDDARVLHEVLPESAADFQLGDCLFHAGRKSRVRCFGIIAKWA